METKFDKIFSETNCPGTQALRKYLHGELSHAEKHAVEKHLIDCEMCSDELEGLKLLEKQKNVNEVIANIDRQITFTKTRPLYAYRSIAAAVLIFIGISSLFFFYNHSKDTNNLLANKEPAQTESTSKLQEETEQEEAIQKTQDTTIKLLAQNTFKTLEQQEKGISTVKEKNISETNDASVTDLRVNDELTSNILPDSTSLAYTETAIATGMSDSDGSTYFSSKIDQVEGEEQTTETLSDKTISGIMKEEETNTELLAMNKGKDSKKEKSQSRQAPSSAKKRTSQEKPVAGIYSNDDSREYILNQAINDYTTENYSEAETKLKQILQTKDFVYFQKAQWYYALTLIKLNKIQKAKKVLNTIIETTNHIYNKKAKDKLQKINDN
ncbi:MAG: zf-HC2 domain-containing protein [Bacteroidales bacterium]|nr:zf-HC2 domain-containing protein [Bacteroidales bacterium]